MAPAAGAGVYLNGVKYRINPEFRLAFQGGGQVRDPVYWPFLEFDARLYDPGAVAPGDAQRALEDTVIYNMGPTRSFKFGGESDDAPRSIDARGASTWYKEFRA